MKMRRKLTTRCTCIIAILVGCQTPIRADTKLTAQSDPAYHKLIELGQECIQLQRKFDEEEQLLPDDSRAVTDKSISDDDWMAKQERIEEKLTDTDQLLPHFMKVAIETPESPFALGALTYVIYRGGSQTAHVGRTPWQLKEQALDLVSNKYMDDPRIVIVLEMLSGAIPSAKSMQFFRTAITNGSTKAIRAAAEFHFARHLIRLGELHRQSNKYKRKERLLNYERRWSILVTCYLEKEFAYDQEALSVEIERHLAKVISSYPDVQATDYKVSGAVPVIWELQKRAKPKTYAELAKLTLHSMNNIAPGKPAPDIIGTDATGKQFRLSDYRGKVVLLTFSANWCGSCVELYPLQRSLVEQYRDEPFVLLSVSRDESIDTLQASIKSGKINWRCWWDGIDGPINEAWNCGGIPALVLLDHEHIVQDVLLNRATPRQEFEQAISKLLSSKLPRAVSRPLKNR